MVNIYSEFFSNLIFYFIFFSKENTMLRANLKSSKVSVIPNAVDSYSFTPDTSLRPSSSDESKRITKK
jgi:hypothetical protein